MRTHREAIVTSSGGTVGQHDEDVAGGGSSIVFSRRPRPRPRAGGTRRGSAPCGRPRPGRATPGGRSRSACSAEIGPARSTSRTSGCSPASASRASRRSASSRPVSRSAANARAASLLGGARRADEQVGVHGRRRPRASCATASAWPTTPSQTTCSSDVVHGAAARRPPRGRAAATSSALRAPSTTIQRSGRRRPSRGSRRAPARGTPSPAARSGRAGGREPLGEHLGGCVEQDHQVGPVAVDGPLVDAAHLVDGQPAAVALVGERRVRRAIGDHEPPAASAGATTSATCWARSAATSRASARSSRSIDVGVEQDRRGAR